jgi:nitroreductase
MLDLLDAMGRARSIRYFRPDPVRDDMLEQVLWAATRASSPVNSQCWDFIVVRDRQQRDALGQCVGDFARRVHRTMPLEPEDSLNSMVKAGKHLTDNLGDVPVIVVIVGELVFPPHRPQERYTYSAMYSAAQNLLVAATGVGLGAAFTTLHELDEARFREILGIPADRLLGVTMPLGWPAKGVGLVSRRELATCVHLDRW